MKSSHKLGNWAKLGIAQFTAITVEYSSSCKLGTIFRGEAMAIVGKRPNTGAALTISLVMCAEARRAEGHMSAANAA